jgi:Leucine-rich repeat (LRR) protein
MFIENIYKIIKKYISKGYLFFLVSIVIGCETLPLTNRNLMSLPNDHITQALNQSGQIEADESGQPLSDNEWEVFFKERNADEVWNVLQNSKNYFILNSVIKEQPNANEVIAGIIHYIHCISYRNPQYLETPLFISLTNNKFKQLIHLPKEIGCLNNLCQLDLTDSNFIAIPADIGELRNLRILNLSKNKLKAVSPDIGKLSSLSNLDLSSNCLQELPVELTRLTELHNLNLSRACQQIDQIRIAAR